MLSLFECNTCCSSLSLEKIKLIATADWVFHVLDFLKLFMMSFKNGLIILRYSSTSIDSVFFFYYRYFQIQYNYYSKKYQLLLVYHNFLLHAQKGF